MDVLEPLCQAMDTSMEEVNQEVPQEPTRPPPPPSKTMLSYFTKLPSKAVVVEETNPRKLAPAFNKQHVEKFQNTKLEQFDAELFSVNNNNDCNQNGHDIGIKDIDGTQTSTNQNEPIIEIKRSRVDEDRPKFYVNYIKSIKSNQHKPFKVHKKVRGPLRAKLLQYHEDIRPPYYGTWQRKSKIINGRRPFAQDEDVFDYEVDSEAEWDIGGPGESLKGDDSEDDEELDDYEIDMKTFVPHGYVSDDEIEAHSDQEETPSANQSVDEICDVEDSNMSVEIIGEKRPNSSTVELKQVGQLTAQPQQAKQNICHSSPTHQMPPAKSKLEIKPISLGIYYEDSQHTILSESKIQFLKAFQGVAYKDC